MTSKFSSNPSRSLGMLLTAMALCAPATGMAACKPGWQLRDAYPNDQVCVSSETYRQVRADNADAPGRVQPGGGAHGPRTCKPGWVWREARKDDLVCVEPRQRAQAKADNRAAASRQVPPPHDPPSKRDPVVSTGADGNPLPSGAAGVAQCKVGGARCPPRMAPLYDESSFQCLCR